MASTQYTENVKLFSGVPFSADYHDTLAPALVDTKLSWFTSNFTPYETNNIMHIKINTTGGIGTMRLSVPNSVIDGINYAYIQSSRGRPYFAFVLGYEYINDGATPGESIFDIAIQKDVLMSCFLGPTQLQECSIIRHHSGSTKFKNPFVPEPFQGGKVLNKDYTRVPVETCKSKQVVMYIQNDPITEMIDPNWQSAGYVDRQVVASSISCAEQFDTSMLTITIRDFAKSGANVIMAYNAPDCLFRYSFGPGGSNLSDGDIKDYPDIVSVDTTYNNYFGTPPRNNKCYYYPYNYLRVYNDSGQYMDLQWELWNNKTLSVEGNVLPPVSVTIAPVGYNGANGEISGDGFGTRAEYQSTHKLSMGNYPVGSWINDAYASAVGSGKIVDGQALLMGDIKGFGASAARYAITHASDVISGVASGGTELMQGAEADSVLRKVSRRAGGGVNVSHVNTGKAMAALNVGYAAVTAAVDMAASCAATAYQADELGGTTGSSNTEFSNLHKYFYTSHMVLSDRDMECLDSLFQRYGYAQGGVVAKPDPYIRPYWTYIQTAGDAFVPRGVSSQMCNQNETAVINAAFRAGITFWDYDNNTAGDIGNFDRDNGNSGNDIPIP